METKKHVDKSDKKYVEERMKLIPKAEKFANEMFGRKPTTEDVAAWYGSWSACFIKKMDELAFEAGLIPFRHHPD